MIRKIGGFEMRWASAASLAAKILLSVSLVGALLLALVLERAWAASRRKSAAASPPSAVSIIPHLKPRAAGVDLDSLLPQFPFRIQPRSNRIMINSLNCSVQNWQTTFAPSEVIDFYQTEMTSLGWFDATEDAYNLRPEAQSSGQVGEGLENPAFLEKYNSIRQSRLVLCRSGWTIQISAIPESETSDHTTVSILASPTTSVTGFVRAMTGTFSLEKQGQGSGKGMVFEERSDGNTYRTTMRASLREPAAALQETLSKLRAEGWRQAFIPGEKSDGKRLFAFLVSGNKCAYVCAMPPRGGKGALVMLTDVGPE